MSSENLFQNDRPPVDTSTEGAENLSLSALQEQITERMSKLHGVAEEFYKLQVLLDAIDGRDVLPVPDYLTGRVDEPPRLDEKRRREARERAAQRIAALPPRRR